MMKINTNVLIVVVLVLGVLYYLYTQKVHEKLSGISPKPKEVTMAPKSEEPKAEDLLPAGEGDNDFERLMPDGAPLQITGDILDFKHNAGIDTVGGSLRNANQQLRSDPIIPKKDWPIMNSTIEPDLYRRPLDIKECEDMPSGRKVEGHNLLKSHSK